MGFIGYNRRLTLDGMGKFAEDNKEDVKWFYKDRSRMQLKDGTEIFALDEKDTTYRWLRLDQLILFDDNRWEIKSKRYEFIVRVLSDLMWCSCIPDEFKILEYEDVR